MHKPAAFVFATMLSLLGLQSIQGQETPFTPFKDGYATPSLYNGNSRTLPVRAQTSTAWVVHPLGDGAEQGVVKARLQVYVAAVNHPGRLKVSLGAPTSRLENQIHYTDIVANDSIGEVEVSYDSLQRMVSIPLNAKFIAGLAAYGGLVLQGLEDLDVEIGSLEGGHGALLYLSYAARQDSTLVQSVVSSLLVKHGAELMGKDGTNGLNGRDGTNGLNGKDGVAGANGKDGAAGKDGTSGKDGRDGKPGDSTLVFSLLQDRGARAWYSFDRPYKDSASDNSGNGNTLIFSDNVLKTGVAPGDSALELRGNGYGRAANSLSLNPYREITVSAKVNLSIETPPDTQMVVSKKNQYELAVIKNVVKFRIVTPAGNEEWLTGGTIESGTWTEIQASYDGSLVRFFINGKQSQPISNAFGPIALDTGALYVGARAGGVNGFKGLLDQIKILSYVVGTRDSVGMLPGRVTSAQVVADSVTGLKDSLSKKANLGGADFTGGVSVAGDLDVRSSRMYTTGVDGTKNFWFKSASPEPAGVYLNVTSSAGGPTAVRLAPRGNIGLVVDSVGNVGIGGSSTGAKLDVNGSVRMFGAWSGATASQVYRAASDGFVVGYIGYSIDGNRCFDDAYTDGSTPPATRRATGGIHYYTTSDTFVPTSPIFMPVRKNDYWKVDLTNTSGSCNIVLNWMPLGN